MNTTELNNRKYALIAEITHIESEEVIKKIEKLIDRETHHQKSLLKKSPLAFTAEELKLEIAEAEKETNAYIQDEVKGVMWKK
ncbi:MAG TPA: hypothetical protein VK205_03610 [Prolixibacteraceae bacterium]|nr:hypothetical protein [Prolixibacteraceae bacterium]